MSAYWEVAGNGRCDNGTELPEILDATMARKLPEIADATVARNLPLFIVTGARDVGKTAVWKHSEVVCRKSEDMTRGCVHNARAIRILAVVRAIRAKSFRFWASG